METPTTPTTLDSATTETDGIWETFDALFKTANKQGQIIEGLLERIDRLEAKLGANEARPQSQAQMDSDDRFYAELEAQPEGQNDEADLFDPSDRF